MSYAAWMGSKRTTPHEGVPELTGIPTRTGQQPTVGDDVTADTAGTAVEEDQIPDAGTGS